VLSAPEDLHSMLPCQLSCEVPLNIVVECILCSKSARLCCSEDAVCETLGQHATPLVLFFATPRRLSEAGGALVIEPCFALMVYACIERYHSAGAGRAK